MLNKFKDDLLLNGKSFHTAQNYCVRIEKILSVIPEEQFSTENLNIYLRELQKNNKVSTVNGYICALRAYLKFTNKMNIKLPSLAKPIQTLPKSFNEKEFEDIINILSQVLSNDFIKFKAIFYFLFYTGIRISELENIKRNDFDFENKRVKILILKTKEERIVMYPEQVKQILKEYFESEEEMINAFNITSNNFKQRLKLMKKYFPNINLHPHLFRHAFAVNCLIHGINILTVSKLLGHKNINTTMKYLGLTNEQLEKEYREKLDNKGDNK